MSARQLRKARRVIRTKAYWNIVDSRCRYYCKGSRWRHRQYGKWLTRRARRRMESHLIREQIDDLG